MSKTIYVIDSGWVLAGDEAARANGETHITNATVIRVWGTEYGLGQLAKTGKTKQTVLDACGTVHINDDKIIMRIHAPGLKYE